MSTLPIGGGRPAGPMTPASGAVAAVPLSDPAPALRIVPARADGVPDALATVANPLLRYEALNREINAGYARFAQLFQAIVDPELAPGARSQVRPVWFAFAPYASREVGFGEIAARHVADAADFAGDATGFAMRVFRSAGLTDGQALRVRAMIEAALPRAADDLLRAAACFAKLELDHLKRLPHDRAAIERLFDPRYLLVGAKRLLAVCEKAPGRNAAERFEAVMDTLRNGLEDGNRRIYGDIGGSAQRYLEWRAAEGPGAPAPDRVLDGFRLPGSSGAPRARLIYDHALSTIARGEPRPTDLGRRFLAPPHDTRDMVVAAFALYELAGKTADRARRDEIIAWANNLVAWREQHDAVQPAFTPGTRLPGETDRAALFELMTPMVRLPIGANGGWSFGKYATDRLPARDLNPLTPRSTEYNWARFDHRWPAILDAFEAAYRNPAAVWPMPPADPAVP